MAQSGRDVPSVDKSTKGPATRTRRRTVRWASLAVALVIVPLGVAFGSQLHTDPTYHAGHVLGKPSPSLDLPTLSGARVGSADIGGRSVIVNFWNTWCVPCIQEHPALQAFYERHAHEPDFAMIGIVREDTESAVRQWVAQYHDAWTIAFDPGSKAALAFATSGQPETFAISPAGVVVGFQLGAATVRGLDQMLATARRSG